jgi:hypothetical protein
MSELVIDFDPDDILPWSVRLGAPDWATATPYSVDDVVYDEIVGKYYRCIRRHTSSATTPEADTTHWLLVEGGLFMGQGETIDTVNWYLPTEFTENASTTETGYVATLWLEDNGSTDGTTYTDCHLGWTTSVNPSETKRSFKIKVKSKKV